MVIDPVCKMRVNENTAKSMSNYRGKIYYFCIEACKKEFNANPEQYIADEIIH